MIDSNIPCDSRKLVVDEAKESLASPSFHDRFRKLKWIRYFSIRDELSTREINFTFSSPSLPASFSIRPSPIQIVWSASDRSNRVTKFRKLELRTRGTDSNYLSDWNIQNADNPSPPPAPRCCLDASTNSRRRSGGKRRGKGRFDRILNEGSKGFIFVKKKKRQLAELLEEERGRGGCTYRGRGRSWRGGIWEIYREQGGRIFRIRLEYSRMIMLRRLNNVRE